MSPIIKHITLADIRTNVSIEKVQYLTQWLISGQMGVLKILKAIPNTLADMMTGVRANYY